MAQRSTRPHGHDPGFLTSPGLDGPWNGSPRLDGSLPSLRPGLWPVVDGTMCRDASPRPGPTREVNRVATLAATDKLLEAMRRAAPLLPAEIRDDFLVLISPANLAVTVGVLALWVGAHAFGSGEVIDLLLLVAGGLFLGLSVFDAARDLALFVRVSGSATTEAELDLAARHVARFVSVVGVATLTSLIMKAGGKAMPRKLSGLVEREATSVAIGPTTAEAGPWWEAYEFGPDLPGTTVPQAFKLRVAGREFLVKGTYDTVKGVRGASKHMGEYAAKYGTAGGRAAAVDYPLSPIAAALEQVEKSGDLGPLFRGQVKRLGTKDSPYVKGGWEFSFEINNGNVEVFHAVPKGP